MNQPTSDRQRAAEYNEREKRRAFKRLAWCVALALGNMAIATFIGLAFRSFLFAFPFAGLAVVFGILGLDSWGAMRDVDRRDWERISRPRRSQDQSRRPKRTPS